MYTEIKEKLLIQEGENQVLFFQHSKNLVEAVF